MGCTYAIDPNFHYKQLPNTIVTDISIQGKDRGNRTDRTNRTEKTELSNKMEEKLLDEDNIDEDNEKDFPPTFETKMDQIMYELSFLKKRAEKYNDKQSIKKINW